MGMRGSCFSWVLSLLCSNDEPWGPQWGAGRKQRQDAVWNSPRGRQLVSSALVSHSPRPRWGATSGPHTRQNRVNYRTRHISQPQDTPGGEAPAGEFLSLTSPPPFYFQGVLEESISLNLGPRTRKTCLP